MFRFLAAVGALLLLSCPAAFAYLGGSYVPPPSVLEASTFPEAAKALAEGPTYTERGLGYERLTPPLTVVRDVTIDGNRAVVDMDGPGLKHPLPDAEVDAILHQFSALAAGYNLEVVLLIGGKPLDSIRMPEVLGAPRAELLEAPAGIRLEGVLAGKSVTVSAGHGWFWNGSTYHTQRPVYCAPLNQEDFHNLEISKYLMEYLAADGAVAVPTRETDMNRGNHPVSGKPWWQMAAPYFLYDQGYPQWVYSPITSSIPGDPNYKTTQVDDDRRSRPESSNYDATDLYVAIHTNGLAGDCYSNCPTGIEMYRDSTNRGGAAIAQQGYDLANKSQDSIWYAVKLVYDPAFPCRNNCDPRDTAFTEIHYPRRPACLLELGFHDSCLTDAVALRDEVFRSAAMWGYYRGICLFFGVTPTWDLRSYEVVSYSIPTVMKGGTSFTSTITLRNRGCVWNEQHQFRLGHVATDGLAQVSRVTVDGSVGPGEIATFEIPMKAPMADGMYYTDWRMVQDERNAWFGPTVAQLVRVDASPPSSPGPVDDGGPVTADNSAIQASWSASTDLATHVDRYEYRVTDDQGAEIVPWTSNGLNTSKVIPVSLQEGRTYYVWVKAIDAVGWETDPVQSPGVQFQASAPVSIGEARQMEDTSLVSLVNKRVSSTFDGYIYVQEPDRSAGIRVDSAEAVGLGSVVHVTGTLSTVNGERRIVDASVVETDQPVQRPAPLFVSSRTLGGSAFGSNTPGVTLGTGLNNLGLLVRVAGTVTAHAEGGFRISDGGVADDGSGSAGVWISSGLFHKPAIGEFAIVTGISSLNADGVRQVLVSQDSDISP